MTEVIRKKYLTLAEAAEWYRVSDRTLRRRIAEGRLPAVRVGPRTIRVLSVDVEALARPISTADGGDAGSTLTAVAVGRATEGREA